MHYRQQVALNLELQCGSVAESCSATVCDYHDAFQILVDAVE